MENYFTENILICDVLHDKLTNFHGLVVGHNETMDLNGKNVYLACDANLVKNLDKAKTVLAVKNISINSGDFRKIPIGQVPLNVHNVGILFKNYFDDGKNYFNLIKDSHKFQSLTESNKKKKALRSGIYLSNVTKNNGLKFNLLRCSSNFDGPTENFRNIDRYIIKETNYLANKFFVRPVKLNHVLAQIYENKKIKIDGKTYHKKARIGEHSDKTKDMRKDGIIVFCSFYDYFNMPNNYVYKKYNVLTKLKFRLKKRNNKYKNEFEIILYPNSVFMISLRTNRLYTHKIVPSALEIKNIPTRMGYTIRCSNTEAIFKDKTYIIDNELIELQKPTIEQIDKLKQLYLEENKTNKMVFYHKTYFSLNDGDYLKPLV